MIKRIMRITRLCIVLLGFFSFQTIHSQNYITYHQKIVQAEDSITMENYECALNIYCDAFSDVNYSFTKDVYNAAICAAITNDTLKLFSFIEHCLKQGVVFNTFETNSAAFGIYHTTEQWKKLRDNADNFNKNYSNQLNVRYNLLLDSLNQIDQIVRSQHKYYVLHKPKSKKADIQRKNIRYVDSSNYACIKQLITQYGYPSERNIGIGKSLYYYGHVCIWHITDSSFLEIQKNAFLNGEIPVERFVAKMEYCHKDCFNYMWKKTSIDDDFDAKRASIGFPQSQFFEHLRTYYVSTHNKYGFIFPYFN